MEFAGGWDCVATLVDGRWVERRPRRPEVAEQLRRETRLMPWLAPRLPLPVPIPEVVEDSPVVVRHEFVPGRPVTSPSARHGHAVGTFLRALHDCPVADALRHGLPPAPDTDGEFARTIGRFRSEVVPMLPAEHSEAAIALLDTAIGFPGGTVVHGDLGPSHVLTSGDAVTGIIDFGDTRSGDAAIDLAWTLHGTPAAFAEALGASYGVTASLRERALVWHQLGPWHEVTHGRDIGDPGMVRSGVAGLLDRLTERGR